VNPCVAGHERPEMTYEESNLKLIAIFHYVLAAFISMFSMIPMLYLGMGILVSLAPMAFESSDPTAMTIPPVLLGLFFGAIGLAGTLLVLVLAALLFFAGRNLQKTRHMDFCTVVAAVSCLFVPFGTILGVFTLLELNKKEVRELFDPPARGGPVPPAASSPGIVD